MSFTEHLMGLAELEDNVGKKVAFQTSAETIERLERERNELAAQVERLRGALDGIANPIGKLVKEAEDAGADIDGVYVVQFAKDAEMLKGWARSALAETPAQSLEAVKREAALERIDAAMDYASQRFGCYDVAENYGDAIIEFLKR